MQFLFEYDMTHYPLEEIFTHSPIDRKISPEVMSYVRFLVTGTLENLEDIDEHIAKETPSWGLTRMHGVDRNILRLALFEMMMEEALPAAVILDEAVELAKKFGGDESPKFINGVLDGIRKKHFAERVVHT